MVAVVDPEAVVMSCSERTTTAEAHGR